MKSLTINQQELRSLFIQGLQHSAVDPGSAPAPDGQPAAAPAMLVLAGEVEGAFTFTQVFQEAPGLDDPAGSQQGDGDAIRSALAQVFAGRYYEEFPLNLALRIPVQALDEARTRLRMDDTGEASRILLASGLDPEQAGEIIRLLSAPRIQLSLALIRRQPASPDTQLEAFSVAADFERLWLVRTVGEGETRVAEFRTTTVAEIWSRMENLLFQLGESR